MYTERMVRGESWRPVVVISCVVLVFAACGGESRTPKGAAGGGGTTAGMAAGSASSGRAGSANGGSSAGATANGGSSAGAGGVSSAGGGAGGADGGAGEGGAGEGGEAGHAGGAGAGPVGGAGGAGNAGGGAGGMISDDAVAAALDGHTILMPYGSSNFRVGTPRNVPENQRGCTATNDPALAATQSHNVLVTMGGTPGVVYDVRLRARGIVESKNYTGGTDRDSSGAQIPADGLYTGGHPDNSQNGYSSWMLRVASPREDYFLNSIFTTSDPRIDHSVYEVDYEFVLPVEGGTSVCLVASDPNTSVVANCAAPDVSTECNPLTLPELDPSILADIGSQPYRGQFIGLRVLGVTRRN